jgi:predicted PurR-regulated permease PerM
VTGPPSQQAAGGLRRAGTIAWNLLGVLLLIGAVLWVLSKFAFLLPAVVFALAFVYIFNPVVSALQSRRIARWLGSCLSYLVLIAVLTLAGFLIFPSIADQGRELTDNFPTIYDDLVEDLEGFAADLGFDVDLPGYEELRERIEANQEDFWGDRLEQITDITLGLLETLLLLVLAPVVAFYVLIDLPTQRRNLRLLIPERHRDELGYLAHLLGKSVGGFLRGQLLVALIVGVLTSFGFWLVGLPFWLLIGMIAGFLNIIPFVGPWVGGFLGVGIALATRDAQTAIWAGLVALIVQQIDNHFISPVVLRATVKVHPALIILGLITGATLGGFWGILLAVPLMAALKIVVGHYWRTRVLGQTIEEASAAIEVYDERPTSEIIISRLRRGEGAEDGDAPAGDPPPPPEEPSDSAG